MQKEEEEKIQQRHEQQMKLRQDLHQANIEIEHYKLMQKEEERIADARVKIRVLIF